MRADAAVPFLLLATGALLVIGSTGATNVIVERLYNTSGTIESSYQPNTRHLWILDVNDSEANIELIVQKLDLGLPYDNLHEVDTMYNYTTGDFILVGAGDDVLRGEEAMFFGKRDTAKRVVVRGGVGHVFFYASQTIRNDTGFTITYNSTTKTTPEPLPTTPTPPPPVFDGTYVALNGINVSEGYNYNDSFRQAIASMSTDFLHGEMNMTSLPDVTPSDVLINNVMTCHPLFCAKKYCVAYNFSVMTLYEGEPVFTKELLNTMVADPDLQQYFTQITPDCQVCTEEPSINTVLYIVIPVFIVVFGVVATTLTWKFSNRSSFSHAKEKYEREQRERMDDQRRRSSGDISILGLGGRSLASQGSLSSRRFTMPFPKTGRRIEEEEEEEEDVDTTGFTLYDPDQGIIDPAQFGLGGGVTRIPWEGREVNHYTNQAFVADEAMAADIQRSSFEEINLTDSDDTDSGGALSFKPRRREKISKTQFDVPADVHSANAMNETAL